MITPKHTMTAHPPLAPDADPRLVAALAEIDTLITDIYIPAPPRHVTETFRSRRTGKTFAQLTRTTEAPK